jgi:hypothetical protein
MAVLWAQIADYAFETHGRRAAILGTDPLDLPRCRDDTGGIPLRVPMVRALVVPGIAGWVTVR